MVIIMNNSKWCWVYFDNFAKTDEQYYLRLVPPNMDVEKAGYPHGLSISGWRFKTKEDALNAAFTLDKFFEEMIECYLDNDLDDEE